MKIHESHNAPNPRRVRVFLAEKSIQVPYEEVDIGKAVNRGEEFRKKNPLSTVPVLELDDGTFISVLCVDMNPTQWEIADGQELKIEAAKADGIKCERCWHYDLDTGKDSRFPGNCPKCVEALT